MQRALYSLLLRLALPAQVLRHLARRRRERSSLREHLAIGLDARADRPLWLHAASVGEVQALLTLVGRLRHALPDVPMLITVGTATGLSIARARLAAPAGGQERAMIDVRAAPWDLPGAARRFIDAVQPRLSVFVETELWPNLIQRAARPGSPVLLASARVSARSTARYLRWAPALMQETVRAFARIGAQSPVDRERFIALGADPAAVECWGNLKFDLEPPAGTAEAGRELRARLAPQRALWVAGSTHPAEEDACLDAHRVLQGEARGRGAPSPLLVMAPRRPERFEEAAQRVMARGMRLQRHAAIAEGREPSSAAPDVVLVDRLGELLPYYAAADVVFVGGSLVPVGGHNLLEPSALGKPVLAGPHTGNAPDVAGQLEAAGALQRVTDAPSLARVLAGLLGDAALARRQGDTAAAIVAAGGGATTRAVQAISAALELPDALPPAR